jgi:hypothetical protein
MVADTELLLDDVGNTTTGPKRTAKAKGFSSSFEQVLKLCEVGGAEQGGASGRGMSVQSLDSTERGPFEPLADSALGHAQSFSNVSLSPPHPMQLPGTQAATFTPTHRRFTIWYAHAVTTAHLGPTLLVLYAPISNADTVIEK